MKRGVLGSDLIQAMRKNREIDPVFVAELLDGRLCLALVDEPEFECIGQDIWDEGVPLEEEVRTCRECGCTDDNPCDGGCSWAGPDICSNCVPLNIELVEPEKVE